MYSIMNIHSRTNVLKCVKYANGVILLKTSNNTAYLHKEFEKIQSLEELDKVYPYDERKKRSLELIEKY